MIAHIDLYTRNYADIFIIDARWKLCYLEVWIIFARSWYADGDRLEYRLAHRRLNFWRLSESDVTGYERDECGGFKRPQSAPHRGLGGGLEKLWKAMQS